MATNDPDGEAQMMSDDFEEENEKTKASTSAAKNENDNDDSDKEDKEDDEKMNLEQSFDLSSDEDDEDEENNLDDLDHEKDLDLDADLDKNDKFLEDSSGKKQTGQSDQDNKDDSHDNKSKNSRESDAKSTHSNATTSKAHSGSGSAASSASASMAAKAAELKKKNTATDASNKELARKRKLEQMEEENKKMQVLMANFSEEQLNRYEIYRRSAFQKSTVKKIIQTVCGKTVSASVVIAMSGIAKVFVGEMVEKALDVKSKWNESGPIQPKHLREAFRLIKNQNKLSASVKAKKPVLFP